MISNGLSGSSESVNYLVPEDSQIAEWLKRKQGHEICVAHDPEVKLGFYSRPILLRDQLVIYIYTSLIHYAPVLLYFREGALLCE